MAADDCRLIVAEAEAEPLLAAIVKIEKMPGGDLDLKDLKTIGMGGPDGTVFGDLKEAEDMKDWIDHYTTKIVAIDKAGVLEAFEDPDHAGQIDMLSTKRTLRLLLDGVFKEEEQAEKKQKIHVVQTGDDAGVDFSNHDFTVTEFEKVQRVCRAKFGRQFPPEYLPSVPVLRKMSYSVIVERALPDLDRISIISLRRFPSEPPRLLLRRYLMGMCTVAAGMHANAPNFDAMGHGRVGGSVYWLSWFDCESLLETFDFRVTGAELSAAVEVEVFIGLIGSMAAMTRGTSPRTSASAAVCLARLDLIRNLTGAAVASASAQAAAAGAAEAVRTDLAGARLLTPHKTPNGLPRMLGGNPKGAPCLDWAKGACAASGMCSFSHEGKGGKKKGKAGKAAAAAAATAGDDLDD